jgi:hypothetical protein
MNGIWDMSQAHALTDLSAASVLLLKRISNNRDNHAVQRAVPVAATRQLDGFPSHKDEGLLLGREQSSL